MKRARQVSCVAKIYLLILLGLPVIFFAECSIAQTGAGAYDQGSREEIERQIDADSLNAAEAEFLRAVLTPDGDSALEIYRQIVLKYPESPISQRALDRIRQYYYALGLYGKAAQFDQALQGFSPPARPLDPAEIAPSEPAPQTTAAAAKPETSSNDRPAEEAASKTEHFCLQVGAFSRSANARQLQAILQKAGYSVILLEPDKNPHRLYVIRVTGFGSEEAAQTTAERLKKDFHLQPIMLPDEP